MKGMIRNTFMMFIAVVLVLELTIISSFVYLANPGLDWKVG